ncbi:DNA mismatch repair endonuclease MutL [Caproicibacterium sp. BJN0003]|uniref:DNA mismatch repair endonuclease MutL n=1 Tax=Caproicibacterium sp. BJN0003 TaxID=2994078 RepID=UPI0022515D16|nr:DNA mismatch repair endonuclease MutL [Caproicibacterium sp. BJN0003]UZT81138.1 DNA mismatch repair endonuclease MutL [Caproicibacterium sp. BJN0003]
MAKINVLDKHVAELIAAGEVVERPSSVIKELVENAVDAGASAVTVEIKNGGVTFMRVTDNGCGIAREDVSNAFLRHATSKVFSQNDLEHIGTLGFRGEALASICAVSHVELLTRTKEELAGTRYVISGGEKEVCEDAGCASGTTILVRDLFYNTPARMKFLKKDVTEGNAVASIIDHEALSRPDISFRFLRDGKETLQTPGDGKLKNSIYAVYGREFTSGLIPVEYTLDRVRVWGFIGKPTASRPNRSMQNFFLNGRYVRSKTAMVSLEQAFKGSIMVGKFPTCVLHIEMDCSAVDVNVHPSKMEVRFYQEKPVFDAVYHAVKSALNVGDKPNVLKFSPVQSAASQIIPPYQQTRTVEQLQIAQKAAPTILQDSKQNFYSQAFLDGNRAPLQKDAQESALQSSLPENEPKPISFGNPQEEKIKETDSQNLVEESPAPLVQKEKEQPQSPQQTLKLVGEAFGTYIILERGGDELLLIDKHAAHERMIYEKLRREAGDIPQQMLLQPIPVVLEKNEYAAVLDHLDMFEKAGFGLEDFGTGTILIRSAPILLIEDAASAVMEMAGYLAQNKTDISTEKQDWLYHNVACRAAVKAGDESSPMELADLALRLERNPDIRYCPHGRPISIVLKRKDLERQFGRIQ